MLARQEMGRDWYMRNQHAELNSIPVSIILHPTTRPRNRLMTSLFADLDTTGGSQSLLDITVDGELTGGQSTDHDETGTDTAERTLKAELLGDLDKTAGRALTGQTLGLVNLRQHSIGGLGNDGGSETSHQTRTQVDGSLHAIRQSVLGVYTVDSLGDLLVDDELGHGVRDPCLCVSNFVTRGQYAAHEDTVGSLSSWGGGAAGPEGCRLTA